MAEYFAVSLLGLAAPHEVLEKSHPRRCATDLYPPDLRFVALPSADRERPSNLQGDLVAATLTGHSTFGFARDSRPDYLSPNRCLGPREELGQAA